MERLDKVLANSGYGTRTEVKLLIKRRRVVVNGKPVLDTGFKIDVEKDEVLIDGKELEYKKYIYLLMNKPKDVISATEDNVHRTVIDLLSDYHKSFKPYPVGRLDIDTTGLLLITNDGDLTHELLSPKKHVPKLYKATLRDEIDDDMRAEYTLRLQEGIIIDRDVKCRPAKISFVEDRSIALLELVEGKFHQVKRMFKALGNEVLELERLSMGSLTCEGIAPGEYKEITRAEITE